jgi:hypothetical protein
MEARRGAMQGKRQADLIILLCDGITQMKEDGRGEMMSDLFISAVV